MDLTQNVNGHLNPDDRLPVDFMVQVFFDGDCPLCAREVRLLKWLDRKKHILFTDIAGSSFHAADYGKSQDELMTEIHGRMPSGTWILGVEVFRQLYTAVGFGILVWFTRLPGIAHLLDYCYRWFAKNRLALTGRCDDGSCKIGP